MKVVHKLQLTVEHERERLYYKFRVEGEREKAEKLNRSRWTVRWFQNEANTFLSSSVPVCAAK